MRLYALIVEHYEAATGWAFPIVTHQFLGRDRDEAMRYYDSHRRSDRFLRECEDRGIFDKQVQCNAVMKDIGWIEL